MGMSYERVGSRIKNKSNDSPLRMIDRRGGRPRLSFELYVF